MNASNQTIEGAPENVEGRINSAPSTSAMIERMGGPEQSTERAWREPSREKCASPASHTASLEEDEKNETEEPFKIPERYTKNGRKKAVSFPLKLMQVLSNKEHADIITWLPDGKSFKIVRPRAFKKDILPRYFREAKYSSFKRKISRWGFQRVKSEDESETDWFGSEVFFHEYFQRGMLDLVEKMSCKKAVPVHPTARRPAQESATSSSSTKPARKPHAEVVASPATPRELVSPARQPESAETARSQIGSLTSLPLPDLTVNPRMQMDSLDAAIDAEVSRRIADASRLQMDSLDAAIDAEVTRRLRERETELALNRNLRLNALVQEQLSGTRRLPSLSGTTGAARSELLGASGMYQTGASSNLSAIQLLGQVPQQPSSTVLEEQRRRLRLLQQAQFLASMSSGNEGKTDSGNNG